ncbi:hypothetical protein GIB67_013240 [Kingdonia uniflora]|uniref:MEKHLA domain-containing protein n=1 Tax=Kingdonia uniflora TaxID=39325 RepID=A0A7J7NST3_9MAGN|nr:hypothetical protein GIB67_013240 [Kingdonia uniflora]
MGYTLSIEGKDLNHHKVETFCPDRIQTSGDIFEPSGELSVSFGYNFCTSDHSSSYVPPTEFELSNGVQIPNSNMKTRTGSFSCLSGAALSANATLANTNICNGVIGEEILPGLDSPKSLRRLASSSSLSRLDLVSSSSISSMSTLGGSVSTENGLNEGGLSLLKTMSAATKVESSSFLNAMDAQMAGGAAGEDRVQAVCSKENGWLFCGVYDGFNGRDAADFLAGVLYENIGFHLHLLEWRTKKLNDSSGSVNFDKEFPDESFCVGVLNCLSRALAQSESFSTEEFMRIPVGRKRKYRDDVMVVVIILGNKYRTSTASTSVNQHGLSFDFGELEESIVFQGVQLRNAEARKSMPLFPYSFSDGSSRSVGESTDSGSAHNTLLELESPTSKRASNQSLEQKQQQLLVEMASDNTSITGPVQVQHFSTPEKIVYVSDDEVDDNQSPVLGLAYLPSGICISTMARHVSYDQIIAWKVLNNENNIHCIAFAFINWSFVRILVIEKKEMKFRIKM